MQSRVFLLSALAFSFIGAIRYLPAQTPRSVWDGVYTDEQAKRGKAFYSAQCGMCHGEDLMGGDETPPLTGSAFLSNWNGLSVNELFERIRVSMPANNPGKLGRQQNADILAFIFSFNKFPAGNMELATQGEKLKETRIEASKP
jgi:mono/diheme cytochrome c family protein